MSRCHRVPRPGVARRSAIASIACVSLSLSTWAAVRGAAPPGGAAERRGLAPAGPAVPSPSASRRPNVVLVMTDDQGYGDLACLGNQVLRTPHLDRLWASSVRLTNYHVDPTCSPTRSALMTGRYSDRVGVWHTIMGRSLLRADETTMADVFARAGYRTAIFGKWHLGDNYPFRPQDRGFQEVFVNGGGGVGQTPDWWGNHYFDDTYFHNGKPEKQEGFCTDVWFGAALRFIEENRSRPFFAYIPTNAAHGPYRAPERYLERFRGKPGVPNAAFYGMLENIDDNMGRLMRRLDELDLAENTILIFTTDNGTSAGIRGKVGFNAGMRGTKGSEYEGGHRVPFFVRWPAGGLGGGRDVDHLTAHLDVLPTLIDLCRIESPAGVELDGRSLAPLLRGDEARWKDRTLVVESQRIEHPEKWRKSAVMTDRWRLVDGKELYDLPADPGQKKDVATAHPEVVARLRARYDAWWASVSRRHGEYCRIVLGNPAEPVSRLTGHDWHDGSPPWSQGHIRRGVRVRGVWAVEVERAGRYRFELRRWPREADRAILDGSGLRATRARVEIAGRRAETEVPPHAKEVALELDLEAGPAKLRAEFVDARGAICGAYYAYVERISSKR